MRGVPKERRSPRAVQELLSSPTFLQSLTPHERAELLQPQQKQQDQQQQSSRFENSTNSTCKSLPYEQPRPLHHQPGQLSHQLAFPGQQEAAAGQAEGATTHAASTQNQQGLDAQGDTDCWRKQDAGTTPSGQQDKHQWVHGSLLLLEQRAQLQADVSERRSPIAQHTAVIITVQLTAQV